MKRWPAVLIFLLLLMPLFSVPASGDGIAITVGYSTLKENRQLAYVTVGDDTESIDLFLSVVSLNVGQKVTIAIPLRTQPFSLNAENTSERDFRRSYAFSRIFSLPEKQAEGMKKFSDDLMFDGALMGTTQLAGPLVPVLVLSASNTGSSGINQATAHYEFDALSVDLYSFNTSDSLGEFYDSLGLTPPANVQSIIDEYHDYSVALVHTLTRPPIPQNEFDSLQANEPEVMADFAKYLDEHPKIMVWGDAESGYYFMDDLGLLIDRISDAQLKSYFRSLVFSMYGLSSDVEGFHLSFDLPLAGGECYFPLGTSPAWGSIAKTEVIFDCPDTVDLTFNKEGQEAFMGGRHYYMWSFESDAPDYDIYGTVEQRGFEVTWRGMGYRLSGWFYEASSILSPLIILSLLSIGWFLILSRLSLTFKWEFSDYSLGTKLGWALVAVILSALLTVVIALPILAYFFSSRHSGPPYVFGAPNGASKASEPFLADFVVVRWMIFLSPLIFVSSMLLFFISVVEGFISVDIAKIISLFVTASAFVVLMANHSALRAIGKIRASGQVPNTTSHGSAALQRLDRVESLAWFGRIFSILALILFAIPTIYFIGDSYGSPICIGAILGIIFLSIAFTFGFLILGELRE